MWQVRPGAWVVCEVQVHLAAILSHKEESHHYYEFFRSYFCGSSDAIEKRILHSPTYVVGGTRIDGQEHIDRLRDVLGRAAA